MAKKAKIAQNLFFLLGLLALGIMIYKIGIDSIWHDIRETGWWFVPIIGLWGIVYLLNTMSWHLIIQDGSPEAKNVGFLRLFKLIISGFAINYITPFGLMGGEPYKVIELQPTLGIQKATSSVLLAAMMHFVSHFIFWMVTIPLLLFLVPVLSGTVELGMIFSSATSFLLLLWAYRVYTRGGVDRALILGSRLPFVGHRIRSYRKQHQDKIDQMDFLIADLYRNRKKDFIISLLLEMLSRFLICVEVLLMMRAIGWPVTFGKSLLIESIQSLVANLLFFMPMQMGSREGGMIIVYGLLSIPISYGVFVSLCKRIREIFWTVVGVALIKVRHN
ncbi:MAG: flippase-like domain-containing protein [Porphyromonadaceae bacterium]|nr:flippase-like domain-containing protein [Porphyromonadaceae bacterium]